MRVYRLGMDLMMLLFLAMGSILYLILPLISISEKMKDIAPPPQGNLMVELYWGDSLDVDVDLWVRGEADMIPVGYSNKGGPLFNLLRDDLGVHSDLSGRNMEIAYSRGLPNGEYVINAHLFNLKSAKLPVSIRVIIAAKKTDDSPYKQLFAINTNLLRNGEEKTVARFVVKDGVVVEGTLNHAYQPLRSAAK